MEHKTATLWSHLKSEWLFNVLLPEVFSIVRMFYDMTTKVSCSVHGFYSFPMRTDQILHADFSFTRCSKLSTPFPELEEKLRPFVNMLTILMKPGLSIASNVLSS